MCGNFQIFYKVLTERVSDIKLLLNSQYRVLI